MAKPDGNQPKEKTLWNSPMVAGGVASGAFLAGRPYYGMDRNNRQP